MRYGLLVSASAVCLLSASVVFAQDGMDDAAMHAEPTPLAPAGSPPPAETMAPAMNTQPASDVKPPHSIVTPTDTPVARDGEVIQSQGGGAIPPLVLEAEEINGIRYITGGVGEEELAQLRSVENEYNVQLLMAGTGGAYISGALVRVLDAKGEEVLAADYAGPYFYVKLAPGKYTLEVTAMQGGIKTAAVTAPASGAVKPILRFTE